MLASLVNTPLHYPTTTHVYMILLHSRTSTLPAIPRPSTKKSDPVFADDMLFLDQLRRLCWLAKYVFHENDQELVFGILPVTIPTFSLPAVKFRF